MDTAMRDWLWRDASKKRTPDRYDLEQFGLDRAAIERRFNGCYERYDLTSELVAR
jgi:hypothetical protein